MAGRKKDDLREKESLEDLPSHDLSTVSARLNDESLDLLNSEHTSTSTHKSKLLNASSDTPARAKQRTKKQPTFSHQKTPNLLLGMITMTVGCILLWGWILSYRKLRLPIQPVSITALKTPQTMLTQSPFLKPVLHVSHTNNSDEMNKRAALNHMKNGIDNLKKRNAEKSILSFEKAVKALNNLSQTDKDKYYQELNKSFANALYLKGFFELQKRNPCNARKWFHKALKRAPKDLKIQNRLTEISNSTRC